MQLKRVLAQLSVHNYSKSFEYSWWKKMTEDSILFEDIRCEIFVFNWLSDISMCWQMSVQFAMGSLGYIFLSVENSNFSPTWKKTVHGTSLLYRYALLKCSLWNIHMFMRLKSIFLQKKMSSEIWNNVWKWFSIFSIIIKNKA